VTSHTSRSTTGDQRLSIDARLTSLVADVALLERDASMMAGCAWRSEFFP